jgi:hypothetical protein
MEPEGRRWRDGHEETKGVANRALKKELWSFKTINTINVIPNAGLLKLRCATRKRCIKHYDCPIDQCVSCHKFLRQIAVIYSPVCISTILQAWRLLNILIGTISFGKCGVRGKRLPLTQGCPTLLHANLIWQESSDIQFAFWQPFLCLVFVYRGCTFVACKASL